MARRFAPGVFPHPSLSVAIGAALVLSLRRLGCEAAIKWPNDILLNGRKLGGVLCEAISSSGDGATLLVAGVGINDDLGWRGRHGEPFLAVIQLGPISGILSTWSERFSRQKAKIPVFPGQICRSSALARFQSVSISARSLSWGLRPASAR
ncbi:MAG: hypothetical protein EBU97_03765 [Rhodobacteraceae bacterium]|nr:hypothetical protein [Paracoccaceae bacterium]